MAREPDSVYTRRRLAAVGAVVMIVIVAVLALRGLDGDDSGSERQQAPDPLAGVSLEQLVGQRLMVRMGDEATPDLLEAAREGTIGGVIMFPAPDVEPATAAREIERLQRATVKGDNPPLLVAIDQEGGEIARLPAGPPQRSPAELGSVGDAAAASAEGEETAAFLRQFGVNVDLAPVLDVPGPGSFMAERAFADDPGTVAEVGVAFAEGLEQGGVAATAKHFPGLGLATVNTDLAPSVVEAPLSDLRPGLEPFEAAIANGIDLVMVGSAIYPELDPGTPAMLSERVVTDELRERLGFGGVVITDDLEAASIGAELAPPDAAVEAAGAGADVLLLAKGAAPGPVAERMLRALERGALERAVAEQSYLRIADLKQAVAAG